MRSPQTVPAVAMRAVTRRFGDVAAVRDLTLEVARGEFLAILGPSGSGKTTAMRLIGGFEVPDAGRVEIAGRDMTDVPAERRPVNTVFQSYALFPHMNVLDNVAYGPRMRGLGRRARNEKAGAFLDLVRLSGVADRRPHELSGGQQQRVALARALANEPEVLLLDEPLGALDRKLREEMQRELRRIQTELGATFIYITHDQEEAFGMADRLAVMRDGRFEQIGSPAEVYDRPASAFVALFVGGANRLAARVEMPGTPAVLASDVGRIVAGHMAEGLAGGDRATVLVRPEATRIVAPGAEEAEIESTSVLPDTINAIPARLTDAVALGASLRLRAETAGGIAFESVMRREEAAGATGLAVGAAVTVRFAADAAHAFVPDDRPG